jgi:hypothetical protein
MECSRHDHPDIVEEAQGKHDFMHDTLSMATHIIASDSGRVTHNIADGRVSPIGIVNERFT